MLTCSPSLFNQLTEGLVGITELFLRMKSKTPSMRMRNMHMSICFLLHIYCVPAVLKRPFVLRKVLHR